MSIMKMDKNQHDLVLLPRLFNKVALGILILSILFATLAILSIINIDMAVMKTIVATGILVSLLIFALTKDKVEDELLLRIRLKAFAGSFIFGVLYVLIDPFINLLFDHDFSSDLGLTRILITMFLFYFMSFYSMKKKR